MFSPNNCKYNNKFQSVLKSDKQKMNTRFLNSCSKFKKNDLARGNNSDFLHNTKKWIFLLHFLKYNINTKNKINSFGIKA